MSNLKRVYHSNFMSRGDLLNHLDNGDLDLTWREVKIIYNKAKFREVGNDDWQIYYKGRWRDLRKEDLCRDVKTSGHKRDFRNYGIGGRVNQKEFVLVTNVSDG